MQTVNFKCGHCGQVMAVGRENLGQQVRCPHCQQVVLAPDADSPAPTPVTPDSPFGNLHEHEDIFIQKRDTEDALFGRAEGAKLELPREPEPSPPAVGYNGPGPDLPPLETLTPEPAPHVNPAPFVNDRPATEQPPWAATSGGSEAVQDRPSTGRSRERKEGFVSPVFLLLVFAPTVLWALGATGIAVWLFTVARDLRNAPEQQQKSPFDDLIDDGDNPGVKKAQGQVRIKLDEKTTQRLVSTPLPDRLKTTLGEPIVVGDLEVKPLRVSRKKVSRVTSNAPNAPAKCTYDSLVLELEFKNLSTEYAFAPLDNYFDRQYKGDGYLGRPPLTLIEAGNKKIFGGPHKWVPDMPRGHKNWEPQQWPYNRKEATSIRLQPGETAKGYVCTDGTREETEEFLFGSKEKKVQPYRGPMLWRVHVRQGPHHHKGRVLSAATVIGVEFHTDKIVN